MTTTVRSFTTNGKVNPIPSDENACDPQHNNIPSAKIPLASAALPKRALGDITNLANNKSLAPNHTAKNNQPQTNVFKPTVTKIRRTTTTKPTSTRRPKTNVLSAAKKPSPMSVSNSRTRRTSSRLAKRAAAAAAAACQLDFTSVSIHENLIHSISDHQPLGFRPLRRPPPTITDIDAHDASDPLLLAQYACEIYHNLIQRETLYMPDPDYMSKQQDITIKMRAILIDWLVDVHQKFKLRPETLHLTVNIIDRFLQVEPVLRRKLQLVGVTAMLVACKYEEVYAPEVADFVYISDKAYSKEEILSMEAHILRKLEFDVTVPSCLVFMKRCLKAAYSEAGLSSDTHTHLTHYLIELTLPDSVMLGFRPSVKAAAACKLSAQLCQLPLVWNQNLRYHSGQWDGEELAECEAELARLLEHERDVAGNNKLTAIKRKFSAAKFANISSSVPVLSDSQHSRMDICKTE